MAKKRGTFSLSGVGTKMEQHAERVLRLVKLNSPHADSLVYESLLILEKRDPERFKTVMTETSVAAIYNRFGTRKNTRPQAILDARVAEQAKREAAKVERKRRRLSLNSEGTLAEQHIDRVKRLWSVLMEKNHNMYQYRTRVAFAESMRWLEENEPNEFQTLLESLEDMTNGDDAYFIFVRHELNQVQKQVQASHEKQDLDLLAPRQRGKAGVNLKESTVSRDMGLPEGGDMGTDERHPNQTTISDLLERDW